MNGDYFLNLRQNEVQTLLLPEFCKISVSCYESEEIQQAVVYTVEETLSTLALSGTDLRSLDGVTVALDTRQSGDLLANLPAGLTPLEMTDQPDTMELARTVAVQRGNEYRFHIVLRAGLGLMTLSPERSEQMLALGCIAHEAAHVEHEGHLHRTFPEVYGASFDCGDRSRQTFLKAMDSWSEYAACRSSANLRPEALEDFERAFCRSLNESRTTCQDWIARYRDGGKAVEAFREIQQACGDAFICAGYLLGHLHGLELHGVHNAPQANELLSRNGAAGEVIGKLERALNELWLSEFAWKSIEAFAPIYDLLCEMMAIYGMAFGRHGEDWRVVMSDEFAESAELKEFLQSKAKERR
jgi:hypothetical protein